MSKLLDGKVVAQEIERELRGRVSRTKEGTGKTPVLAAILEVTRVDPHVGNKTPYSSLVRRAGC